ncbi:fungal hydrophobin [Mycena metata]|uniref:Hydrophobin n=1 Tax=Mycena metata TaxID=1033252 RepID=A0AAD7ILN5_9AGAR|nr:fungal hydrophobin [Mycena metata]
MFSKLSVVVASVLITLAAAIPQGAPPPPVTPPTAFMCCASVVSSMSTTASLIAGLLGVNISSLNVPIGLSCSPITVISNCNGVIVICDAPPAEWGGLMAINCLPVTF